MSWQRTLCLSILVVVAAGVVARAQGPEKLSLDLAQAIALKNHPQIQSAEYAARAANQMTREERSAYYPLAFGSLTGAGALPDSRLTAGGLNNPIIYNRYGNGLMLGQLITDFGRTGNLVASARLEAEASQQNVQSTRQDILLQVDRAYYGALRAQAVLRVAQQTVEARQLVADQVLALAKSKLKSDLDVSFANVNLAQAKLLLAQAQNGVEASFATLSAALGYSTEHTFTLQDTPLPSAPPSSFAQLLDEAFRQRPELIGERLKEQGARKFARAERDLWFPTISMLAGAGVTPYRQVPLVGHYAAAGLNVNIPIFNGPLFSARRARAQFQAQEENQNVRDLEDRIARDVRVAWLNAQTAYQRLALTQQLLDQANLALDLAQARYKLGLGSIVELSQAQLNQTEAQIEQTSARYDYQIQFATLSYQFGATP